MRCVMVRRALGRAEDRSVRLSEKAVVAKGWVGLIGDVEREVDGRAGRGIVKGSEREEDEGGLWLEKAPSERGIWLVWVWF